ncbi:MAG: hypothetical protein E7017_04190 [Alphaproteobacteria bacterium]|nr:hypothetical protein [Alphaproteobacteria bacterium]
MPNILFLSDNDVFKNDILSQINYHIPEFTLSVSEEEADIIVIDEDSKVLDAYLKKEIKAPIILLSSEDVNMDTKVHHIINKPFVLSKFLDDIKASINIFEKSADGSLEFNCYILHPYSKEIVNLRTDEVTKLTEKEVAVIKYLYKNKDKVVTKTDLMQEVWGYAADVATHTVETHIYRLRQKVEHEDRAAQLIITSDGGYQLKI